MTPNDDSLQTATPAVAMPDASISAPDAPVSAESVEHTQPIEAAPQAADAASPTDTIAALAVAEFEALVDEIAAELEAFWDDDDDAALAAGGGDAPFGGTAEPDDGSRTNRIRRYARELVACAYLNRDNSAWDPTVAGSYCSAEANDALLPMLLETRAEADDIENDETKPADTSLLEAAEEAPEGAFEGIPLTREDETDDEVRAGAGIDGAQRVPMRCHV